MQHINQIQELKPILEGANHIDVKVVEGEKTLQEFIAQMFSYYPWWIKSLFRARGVVVRLLGITKQKVIPELPKLVPEDVPMVPGETLSIFTVRMVKEDQYWIADAPYEKHLSASLGVIVEPLKDNLKRFHVITIVHYKHWTGPIYFNIIRPFHHLIVNRMVQAGVKKESG